MLKANINLMVAGIVLFAWWVGLGTVHAQETTQTPRWYENITLNTFLSSSYSYNFNKPDSRKSQFRVFDVEDNSIKADVVELSVHHDAEVPGDAGFRFDLLAGSSVPKVTHSVGLDIGDLDFPQMFVRYVVPAGRGVRLDIGKFVTPLGYEVIEGYENFNDNATHSFLFGYAVPFTHTGLRATYSFSEMISSSFMIVNGWDNAIDNNSSKTVGAQFAITPVEGMNLSVSVAYGPERDSNDTDNRYVLDVVGTYVVSPRVLVGVNADYGREQHASALGGRAAWSGVAGYLRLGLFDQFSLCFRCEQFEDKEGTRTGVDQILREFTVTPEFRPTDHFVFRGDIRMDSSNKASFMRRGSFVDTQTTVSINVLYFY